MVTLVVTNKGAEMKANSWKEGQEISCHENLAADFIKRGIAVDPSEVPTKQKKEVPTKQKTNS